MLDAIVRPLAANRRYWEIARGGPGPKSTVYETHYEWGKLMSHAMTHIWLVLKYKLKWMTSNARFNIHFRKENWERYCSTVLNAWLWWSIISLIIHHSIILPFQTQNFPISQILPSIDIWHLFALISRIPGLHCGFFSVSVFSSFQLSLFPSLLVFLSQVSYLSNNRLFLDFYFFFTFLVPFWTIYNIFSLAMCRQ